MKDTFYFSHDYHARQDEKIIKLISKYGWEAYGLYWAIVEKLYEEGGFLEFDCDCIAFDLRTDSERIKNIIESNLFVISNNKFHSKSVNARLIKRKGKSEMARQSAKQRWDKPKSPDANAMRTQCDGNAIKERKGKERKGKEIITSEQGSQDIKPLMDIFYEINPGLNWGNKTIRSSAEWLIKKYGMDASVAMARQVVAVQGQPYAPRATTPHAMKEKLGDFKIFFDGNKGNKIIDLDI